MELFGFKLEKAAGQLKLSCRCDDVTMRFSRCQGCTQGYERDATWTFCIYDFLR